MKLKFLMCAIFMCAIEKISGLHEDIILLNRSSRECTIDLSETPSSGLLITEYLHPSRGSPNLNEFTLDKDEWRCVYYDLSVHSPQERIVIKTNGEEVGAIYMGAVWGVDPNDPKAKFWVNEKSGLILYQKMPTGRHQLVFKILDFDNEHFRYINPDPRYVDGTHGFSRGVEKEWIITLPKNDNDPRPPYVKERKICRILSKEQKKKFCMRMKGNPAQ